MTWPPSQDTVRLVVFVSVLLALAGAERVAPRRRPSRSVALRSLNNVGVVVVARVVLGAVVPASLMVVAVGRYDQRAGLTGVLGLRGLPAIVFGVVALDFAIWAQHVVFHRVPLLWRVHRMHHADVDFDVSLGVRFHPLEILLSYGIKLACVTALAPPATAVFVFEIVLNAVAMFNHANLRLPPNVDRVLRWVVVTPDMHRVHHSTDPRETHQNFGFNLPWWDRLFGTYTAQPRLGQTGFEVGLPQFRAPRELWIDRMLTLPFRSEETPPDDLHLPPQ